MLKRVMSSVFVLGLVATGVAFAGDSTSLTRTTNKPMHLEATSDPTQIKPATIDPSSGGKLSCPAGFALTSVKATAEVKKDVTVYTECNGVGNWYVHTWCKNSPVNYSRVKDSPTVTYSCQKITNQWVDASGNPKKA